MRIGQDVRDRLEAPPILLYFHRRGKRISGFLFKKQGHRRVLNSPVRETVITMQMKGFLGVLLIGASLLAGCASTRPAPRETEALDVPDPPREFRAAWIATVANIDWPSEPGLPVAKQQAELRALLDRAAELNLNAVIFQVRPAADALYQSDLEPWSAFLSGEMGEAPEPFYDPLRFAVREAHARGLELHAWFNPYRARHPSDTSAIAPGHVSQTHPGWVRSYGEHLWLDPGVPGAQAHTLNVILDVVRRYDIDGVHFDDYFYPYRSYADGADFPDSTSWARAQQRGVTMSRADWRRSNVNDLVRTLYRHIKEVKPHVEFGISPFGIWRPGHPPGTTGFDAYAELYADARKWLREGWVDYFTPQLYYRLSQTGQPYSIMLRWWAEQNTQGRHLWPGNYTSSVEGAEGWPPSEIIGQIYSTRSHAGASGNVHFSMKALMPAPDTTARGSLAERLQSGPYAEPALVPASPWLDDDPPGRPRISLAEGGRRLTLSPASEEESVRWWVVRWRQGGDWSMDIVPGGQYAFTLQGAQPEVVAVSAVDRTGNEGAVALVQPQLP